MSLTWFHWYCRNPKQWLETYHVWSVSISMLYGREDFYPPTILGNSEGSLGIEIMIAWSRSLETKPSERGWQAVWHAQGKLRFPSCSFLGAAGLRLGVSIWRPSCPPAPRAEALLCPSIFRAECKAQLLTLSPYFNKCWSPLPVWCHLIQCHYFVFVLYGDVYHKERKRNDGRAEEHASAHQNRLSLEGPAKPIPATSRGEYWKKLVKGHRGAEIASPKNGARSSTFQGWKKHRFSLTKAVQGNISLYLAVHVLRLVKLLHLKIFSKACSGLLNPWWELSSCSLSFQSISGTGRLGPVLMLCFVYHRDEVCVFQEGLSPSPVDSNSPSGRCNIPNSVCPHSPSIHWPLTEGVNCLLCKLQWA